MRHTIIYSLAYIVLCTMPLLSLGQDEPEIIPPSPETAAFFRFQDYPMDYSTGLPQITIPLYEVKSGDLSVPISISYHASGTKVSDRDGSIAAGWSLNTGGMISRTIYGSADFGEGLGRVYPFPDTLRVDGIDHTIREEDLAYLEKIMHFENNPDLVTAPGDWLDSEYDVFSYSFGGNSGKFIFEDENGQKTPVIIPNKQYIITPITDPVTPINLEGIEVIDDRGTFYSFEGLENAQGLNIQASTGYLLKEMKTANGSDQITFDYEQFIQTRRSRSRNIILNDDVDYGNDINSAPEMLTSEADVIKDQSYSIARISEITFKLGKVVFNLVEDSKLIDNIQVFNSRNELIKTIQFERTTLHSLHGLSYDTHKLDRILFKDGSGKVINKYTFDYYPVVYSGISYMDYYQTDWWGYYNLSGEQNMVPYQDSIGYINLLGNLEYISLGNSNATREPNLSGLKSGVLKKITYPPGGSTEFLFENNKYLNKNNEVKNGPGLRIASIVTNDGNGGSTTKTYSYGTNESGYGLLELEPEFDKMQDHIFISNYPNDPSYRQRTFLSGFNPKLSDIVSRPVVYTKVTEYNGTKTNNIGKTEYDYDLGVRWGAANMPGVKWDIYDFNYYDTPVMTHRTDYKYDSGSNDYQKVRKSDKNYSAVNIRDIYGLHVQRLISYTYTSTVGDPPLYMESKALHVTQSSWPWVPIYSNREYRIRVGYKKLTSSVETQYDKNSNEIVNSTTYDYNERQLISEETKLIESNDTIIIKYEYPFDQPGTNAHDAMLTSNMMNYVVEQKNLKNTELLSGVKTEYYDFGNSVIAPKTISSKTGTNPYEARVEYHAYDTCGNVLSVSKTDGPKTSYIWSYSHSYPVIKGENVEQTTLQSAVTTAVNSLTGSYQDLDDLMDSLIGKMDDGQGNLRQDWKDFNQALRSNTALGKTLITTYTYDPLIGMTSQTDPAGITTYYEYDGYGRLMQTEDPDEHIREKYNYNYREVPDLSVNESDLEFGSSAGNMNATVTSNIKWTTSITYDDGSGWITVSPASDSATSQLTVTVTDNPLTTQRKGTVTVSDDSGNGLSDQAIAITQAGIVPSITLSKYYSYLYGSNDYDDVSVTSNVPWTWSVQYYDDYGWLMIHTVNGSGYNGTLQFNSIDAPPYGETWYAEIEVTGGGITRTISVYLSN